MKVTLKNTKFFCIYLIVYFLWSGIQIYPGCHSRHTFAVFKCEVLSGGFSNLCEILYYKFTPLYKNKSLISHCPLTHYLNESEILGSTTRQRDIISLSLDSLCKHGIRGGNILDCTGNWSFAFVSTLLLFTFNWTVFD